MDYGIVNKGKLKTGIIVAKKHNITNTLTDKNIWSQHNTNAAVAPYVTEISESFNSTDELYLHFEIILAVGFFHLRNTVEKQKKKERK